MTLAVQVIWTPNLKAIAAKLERRIDRVMPYPPRPRIANRLRAIARRAVALIEDRTQLELFRR